MRLRRSRRKGRPGRRQSDVRLARHLFLAPVHLYRYTLSAFMGRTCRHMPSCSEYLIEAVERHGIWPGGWMGFARICRCRPGGTSGLDFVCEEIPTAARWYRPWLYGLWRRTNAPGNPRM
ncbi:MAG: membrane protein insertion efficiency factor YidD [Methylobacterium sp.]|nr:membrane protein insertion efficiency factor YidD [Methylobacterium sp.]MCA4911199.1 membrane protein insertion efficiency factor YidD [Methylobacterium sp.]